MAQVPCVYVLTVQASGVGNTVDCGRGLHCHVCGTDAGHHGASAVWRL